MRSYKGGEITTGHALRSTTGTYLQTMHSRRGKIVIMEEYSCGLE